MTLAIALVLTASGPALADGASGASMRDQIIQANTAEARASVTILQPEVIDFKAIQSQGKTQGERAQIRRDSRGTIWLEFS